MTSAKLNVAIAFLGFALLCVPAPAEAQRRATSGQEWTAISGGAGTASFTLDSSSSSSEAIAGVRWRENVDVPCTVWALLRDLRDGTARVGSESGEEADSVCGLPDHVVSMFLGPVLAPLGSDDAQAFISRNRRVVRGVQVCRNSGNGRVKGIRVYAARVTTSGDVSVVNGRQEDKKLGCGNNEWRQAVYCPPNKIAFGLRVHHEPTARGRQDKITGLSLSCWGVRT